jgi:DNA adenine methylase
MKSPLNYLGGKSRLAEKIVRALPSDHLCYCEAFCGASWVLFSKPASKCEVINDLDNELITFWRVIQNHLEEFLRYFRFAVTSRKIFEIETRKHPETLTDVQRAVRYYYLQRCGFGGKVCGRTFGTSSTRPAALNLSTIEERLIEVHWRLSQVMIEHLDACECVRRYDRPTTLFYLDPPYWETCGYAVRFGEPDYIRLRDTLLKISGRFVMSLNDVPAVRALFRQFRIQRVTTKYSTGNGSVDSGIRSKVQSEVLIRNF